MRDESFRMISTRYKRVFGIMGVLAVLAGCGPNHIQGFAPRIRHHKPGAYAAAQPEARPTTGSLFSEANGGLLQDTRAQRVGDIVIIHIDEQADAKGNATTKLTRDNKKSLGVENLAGLVPAIKRLSPDMDPAKLLALASSSEFSGDGATARKGALTGNISVRVKNTMPNGDLYLEGTKVVMINNEEYHLYVSGLIRPADVGQDNSVSSSRIADAQVEFTGRGDIAEQQDRGWLAKLLDKINPF